MTQTRISKTRRAAPFVVLAVVLLVAGGYTLEQRTRPVLLNGPMVHMPAMDTLTITWSVDAAFSGGWVGIKAGDGARSEVQAEFRNGRYEATIFDLKPGRTCTYAVYNKGLLRSIRMSGPHDVATPARRGRSFRFCAFGDSGIGSNAQATLAEALTATRPDVVIHVGDLVYPSGRIEDYPTHFFEPNAALIRRVPFMASLGNHDVATDKGQPLLDVFVLPENGPQGVQPERNYYFDYGDARFVALDSNRADHGGSITLDQMKTVVAPWLRGVLTDCDARWRFVYFHHPFYTNSLHRVEEAQYMKNAFIKVFEECGVDIVFCGHNHLYERTAPIRNDAIVPEGRGVVYITTGAGGANRYPAQQAVPDYIRVHNDKVYSFTQVDVTGERVELTQIDDRGNAIDEYVIAKPGIDNAYTLMK